MLKQVLIDRVITEFERLFVISPRNPFTIDDPNVIVRQGSKLYAVYVPSAIERNNYDHLLRRLFFSQMAYGSSLITILLLNVDDKIDEYGEFVMKYSFNHISRGVEDAVTFIKKGDRRNKNWDSIYEAKQWMFAKYDVNTLVTRKYYQDFITRPSELLEIETVELRTPSFYCPNKQRKLREVLEFNNGLIFHRKKQKSSTFKSLFEPVMTQMFLRNFRYDNGYIYPVCNIVDSMPTLNTDWQMLDKMQLPNDYCKALSFSGVLPINIPDMDSFNIVYQDYLDLQDTRKYVKRKEN